MTIPRNLSFLAQGASSTGVLSVPYGGTGLTTLTAGYIPYGNGTGAYSSTSNFNYDGTSLTIYGGGTNAKLNAYSAGQKYIDFQWYGGSIGSIGQTSGTFVYLDSPLLGFRTGGVEAMRIQASGGVSIGNTTDPGATNLSVQGQLFIGQTSSAYSSGGRGLVSINGTSEAFVGFNTGGSFKGYIGNDGTNFTQENQVSTGYIRWVTNGSERMRIFASGGVSIGNTTDAGAASLNVSGLIYPQQATTAAAPAYVKGAIYFDTTLNKLRVGGATAWETITSV